MWEYFFFLCEFLKSQFGRLPNLQNISEQTYLFVWTIDVSGHRILELEKTLTIAEFNTLTSQTENQKD